MGQRVYTVFTHNYVECNDILNETYFPAFLKISLAIGTVEFTGFEMIAIAASGHTSAAAY